MGPSGAIREYVLGEAMAKGDRQITTRERAVLEGLPMAVRNAELDRLRASDLRSRRGMSRSSKKRSARNGR